MKDIEGSVIVEERDMEGNPIYFTGEVKIYTLEKDIRLEATIGTKYSDTYDYFIDFVSYPGKVWTDYQKTDHGGMLKKDRNGDLVGYFKVEGAKIDVRFIKNAEYNEDDDNSIYYYIEEIL